jgi:hypothetical protein
MRGGGLLCSRARLTMLSDSMVYARQESCSIAARVSSSSSLSCYLMPSSNTRISISRCFVFGKFHGFEKRDRKRRKMLDIARVHGNELKKTHLYC